MRKKDLPHDSAHTHVCGESEFIDDRPFTQGELHVGLIFSPVAHGTIKKLDLQAVAELPGVVGVFTHKDFAHNDWGPIVQDQPLLAADKVLYAGEPIAVVAAESAEILANAKALARLELVDFPPILSIDEAIKRNSFLGGAMNIQRGGPTEKIKSAHRIKGALESAGQEHFYLESQAAIAYPREGSALEIHSSSQHPTEVQHVSAHALGLPYHQVVSVVKRMGGGFGGKESQASHVAAMAALVAHKTKRAARIVLSKDDDMKITGKRHPFKSFYEVGFDEKGKIQFLKVDLFADGGAYTDLSPAVLQRAMLHVDNAYFIPHAEITGRVCLTHTAPNTAFRGFGGPQGVAVIENIMEEIARFLGTDSLQVRKINCYGIGERNVTPYGQEVSSNTLPGLFSKLENSCHYQKRRKEVEAFNEHSETHLKGISLTAVKFGISFTNRFLNQGNALVNLHTDGTLQVSTGATDMGQGVNAKIQAIVSDCFSIPASEVRIMPTSTEKNHNTSATAASSGTDINGSAALMAAEKIKYRLATLAAVLFKRQRENGGELPSGINVFEVSQKELNEADAEGIHFEDGFIFDEDHPGSKISLSDLAKSALYNRIGLGEYAHYKTPHIYFDKDKGQGRPFLYYTNGVAASEVLIDRFTGDVKILRSDVLMDLGRTICEGIDHGQIAGAFVQGAGWVTTEELCYSAKGNLLSHSPTTYKIPNIQDMPRVFNINLIENDENILNVKGSKAVGEPPFLLALSVWTAIKSALGGASALKLPATPEEILMKIHGDFSAPGSAVP